MNKETTQRFIVTRKNAMYDIAAQIIKNDYRVIDNHRHKELSYVPIGLVMKESGAIGLLLDCKGVYCLNEVYISEEDNTVHLSKLSIGNNINGIFDIDVYNSNCTFESSKLIEVVYLKDMHVGSFNSFEEFDTSL